ncbi:MAG TPA: hypothetical protein VG013_08495 [Gemmataceae bacterium]|jgi:hypothetical protein|nr:hypothetical protein [Gemmataceae bacterium]
MCWPSKVTDDWVVKGCHIHVDGVELAVRPTHAPTYRDGVVFKKVFRSTSDDVFQAAARKAREECLPNPIVRARWRRALEQGIAFVRSFSGEPADKANGRQYEFICLIRHLDAYEVRHGNA